VSKSVLKEAACIAMEQLHDVCRYALETIITLHHHYQTIILNQIYNGNQDEMSNKKRGGKGGAQTTLQQKKSHDVDRPTQLHTTNRNKTAKKDRNR
jgi:hypothetical protein